MHDRSGHNVQRRADSADSAEQDARGPIIGAVAWREDLRSQRGVREPADIRGRARAVQAVAAEKAEVEKQPAEGRYPEAERVQAWKRHIPGAQHQWNQIVAKTEKNRHPHEKDHGGAVHRKQSIEHLRREKVILWNGELNANQHRFQAGDDQKNQCVPDIHQADLLVIDGGGPGVQRLEKERARLRRRLDGVGDRGRIGHISGAWSGKPSRH